MVQTLSGATAANAAASLNPMLLKERVHGYWWST